MAVTGQVETVSSCVYDHDIGVTAYPSHHGNSWGGEACSGG